MSDEQASTYAPGKGPKELYREPTDEPGMEYYQPHVWVEGGAIGMNAGGKCIVMPIRKWVEYVWSRREKEERGA